jgi:hypothetical protein
MAEGYFLLKYWSYSLCQSSSLHFLISSTLHLLNSSWNLKWNLKFESEREFEMETKVESKVNTEIKCKVESKAESKAESEVGWLFSQFGISPSLGRAVRRDPGRKGGNRQKMVDKRRKV